MSRAARSMRNSLILDEMNCHYMVSNCWDMRRRAVRELTERQSRIRWLLEETLRLPRETE